MYHKRKIRPLKRLERRSKVVWVRSYLKTTYTRARTSGI